MMIKNRNMCLFACLIAVAILTGCEQRVTNVGVPQIAQQPPAAPATAVIQPIVRGAESGKKQQIGTYQALNPDCSNAGYLVVTIVKPPANGQATAEKGESFPRFPKENIRSACNSQKLPSMILYYTSNLGFTGTDTVSVEALNVEGFILKETFVVTVR